MTTKKRPGPTGLAHALGAFVIWGLFPLYLLLIIDVPALEFVAWRGLFTLPLCLMLVIATGKLAQVLSAFRNRATLGLLAVSAFLIAANWAIMVVAVQEGHVLATSIGYYINPLVNVAIGTLLLKEKLSRAQWIAVGLAGLGVAVLVTGTLNDLWISLSLALCFSFYGYVRKRVPVDSLPGLTVETTILVLPALAVLYYYAAGPEGTAFGSDIETSLSIILGGILTATPLLLFASAARKLDYSALGFIQFLAPTLGFILGLTVFREPLQTAQAVCFLFIWGAIAVYCWDLLRRRPAQIQG